MRFYILFICCAATFSVDFFLGNINPSRKSRQIIQNVYAWQALNKFNIRTDFRNNNFSWNIDEKKWNEMKSRIEVLLLFLLVSVCDVQFLRVTFYNEQYSWNVCRTRQLVIRLSENAAIMHGMRLLDLVANLCVCVWKNVLLDVAIWFSHHRFLFSV